MKRISLTIFIALGFFTAGAQGQDTNFHNFLGDLFQADQPAPLFPQNFTHSDPIHRWNEIAINASGLDHTPVPPGDPRVFGEQIGPGRSSRAMAIVHIAMFDTINAVERRYRSYTGVTTAHHPLSLVAAISQAAHDTLVAMYPSQALAFHARLAEDLARVHNVRQRINGVDLGRRVAAAILEMRLNDGSQIPEPVVGVGHITSNLAGHWRQDPISLIPLALGAHWG